MIKSIIIITSFEMEFELNQKSNKYGKILNITAWRASQRDLCLVEWVAPTDIGGDLTHFKKISIKI